MAGPIAAARRKSYAAWVFYFVLLAAFGYSVMLVLDER